MGILGFESWLPYRENLSSISLEKYELFQGDLIRFSNTPLGLYYMSVSGCCDIYRIGQKLDYLSIIKVIPLCLFLESRILDKKQKETLKGDDFSTPPSLTISSSEFENHCNTPSFKSEQKDLFKNESLRYIFLPNHPDFFNYDVVLDLQSVTSVELIPPVDITTKGINHWLPKEQKITELFARLDYRYRDFILQKLSTYLSRIALPEYSLIDPKKDESGFFYNIMSRSVDDFKKLKQDVVNPLPTAETDATQTGFL